MEITRTAPGMFCGKVGDMPVWFTVDAGRVTIDEVCNGLAPYRRELRRALQNAYKGA